MKRIPMRVKAHVDGKVIVYEGVLEITKKRTEPKPRPRKRVTLELSRTQRGRFLNEGRARSAKRLRTS
jgi:hypothetical protein